MSVFDSNESNGLNIAVVEDIPKTIDSEVLKTKIKQKLLFAKGTYISYPDNGTVVILFGHKPDEEKFIEMGIIDLPHCCKLCGNDIPDTKAKIKYNQVKDTIEELILKKSSGVLKLLNNDQLWRKDVSYEVECGDAVINIKGTSTDLEHFRKILASIGSQIYNLDKPGVAKYFPSTSVEEYLSEIENKYCVGIDILNDITQHTAVRTDEFTGTNNDIIGGDSQKPDCKVTVTDSCRKTPLHSTSRESLDSGKFKAMSLKIYSFHKSNLLSVTKSLDNFFINLQVAFEEYVLKASYGRIRLLENDRRWRKQVTSSVQFLECGIGIKGTKEDYEKFEQILTSVCDGEYTIAKPGDIAYCSMEVGQKYLRSLEQQYHVGMEIVTDITPFIPMDTKGRTGTKIDVTCEDSLPEDWEVMVAFIDRETKQPLNKLPKQALNTQNCVSLKDIQQGKITHLHSGDANVKKVVVYTKLDATDLLAILKTLSDVCNAHSIKTIAIPYVWTADSAMDIISREVRRWNEGMGTTFPDTMYLVVENKEYEKLLLEWIHRTHANPADTFTQPLRVYGNTLLMQCGLRIQLSSATIADSMTDVIVNSVSHFATLNTSGKSTSLLRIRDDLLEKEFEEKALALRKPDDITGVTLLPGDLIVTSHGPFKCQRLYHVHCGKWQSHITFEAYKTMIKRCLLEADKATYTSISFPAIGTRHSFVPAGIAAKALFEGVIEFGTQHPLTTLKKVQFVTDLKETEMMGVFMEEMEKNDILNGNRDDNPLAKDGNKSSLIMFFKNGIKLCINQKRAVDVKVQNVKKESMGTLLRADSTRNIIELNSSILNNSISEWKMAVFACLKQADLMNSSSITFDNTWNSTTLVDAEIADIFIDVCTEFTLYPKQRLTQIHLCNVNDSIGNAFENRVSARNPNVARTSESDRKGWISGIVGMLSKSLTSKTSSPERDIQHVPKVTEQVGTTFQLCSPIHDTIFNYPVYDILRGMELRIFSFDETALAAVKNKLDQHFGAKPVLLQEKVYIKSNGIIELLQKDTRLRQTTTRKMQFLDNGIRIRGSRGDIEQFENILDEIVDIRYAIDNIGDVAYCSMEVGQKYLHKLKEQYNVGLEIVTDITPYIQMETNGCTGIHISVLCGDLLKQDCQAVVAFVDCDTKDPMGESSRQALLHNGEYIHNLPYHMNVGDAYVLPKGNLKGIQIIVLVGNSQKTVQGDISLMVNNLLNVCTTNDINTVAFQSPWQGDAVLQIVLDVRRLNKDTTICFPINLYMIVDSTEVQNMQQILDKETQSEQHIRVFGDVLLMECGLRVQIVKGSIADEKVDVIINSLSRNLTDKKLGLISKSLFEKGGQVLETEFQTEVRALRKTDDDAKFLPGEMIVTKGGSLECTKVYHVYCGFKTQEHSTTIHREYIALIEKCLIEAHQAQYMSISFPAIGTSRAVPHNIAAEALFDAVIAFGNKFPDTTLRTIRFVTGSDNTKLLEVFEEEIAKRDISIGNPIKLETAGQQKTRKVKFADGALTIELTRDTAKYLESVVCSVADGQLNTMLRVDKNSKVIEINISTLFTTSDWKKVIFACLVESLSMDSPFTMFDVDWKGANMTADDIAEIFTEVGSKFTIYARDTDHYIYLVNADDDIGAAFDRNIKQVLPVDYETKRLSKDEYKGEEFMLISPVPDLILQQHVYDIFKGITLQIYSFDKTVLEKVTKELDQHFDTAVKPESSTTSRTKSDNKHLKRTVSREDGGGTRKLVIDNSAGKYYKDTGKDLISSVKDLDSSSTVTLGQKLESPDSHAILGQHNVCPGVSKCNDPEIDVSRIGNPTLVKLAKLSTSDRDYEEIKGHFLSGTGNEFTLLEIFNVNNSGLYKRFKLLESHMRKKNRTSTVQSMLWHGSKYELIDTIVTNGFNRSYAGTNAVYFGKGSYFARDVAYACRELYSPEDPNGFKYVYYCEVLTGDYTQGSQSITDAPPKDPHKSANRFDSTVNNMADPNVFVVFRDNQAYPKYLIKFR